MTSQEPPEELLSPPLSDLEKLTILDFVESLARGNRAAIDAIAKAPLFTVEVFLECLEYTKLSVEDVPTDIPKDAYTAKTADGLGYDFLMVSLAMPSSGKNRIQIMFARDSNGGNLRLAAIGDIEPEDW